MSIARRHYVEGRTKIEIAEEFQLSRFKVARLLQLAREQGLVRIEIDYSGTIDVSLSSGLQDRYGLRHAIVVQAADDHAASLRRSLGQAAAQLLAEVLTPLDVLGLAWARSVQSMVEELDWLPRVPVVQLTGVLSDANATAHPNSDSSVDIVRHAARRSGGPAYVFFAPFIVHDAATAQALRRQPDLARAFDKIGSVSVAVVGIGHWAPNQSTLYEAATTHERSSLRRQGVCAEVAGVFLDVEGRVLETELSSRMITVNDHQLRAVRRLIAIPYGVPKVPAVRAALRSGLIDGLVTHASMAEALLAADPEARSGTSC